MYRLLLRLLAPQRACATTVAIDKSPIPRRCSSRHRRLQRPGDWRISSPWGRFTATVHEDMRADFAAYPQRWGLTQADANIDHRRVPNLERCFERANANLPLSERGADYLPQRFAP